MEDRKSLADLQTLEEATVVKVVGYGAFRKRIMEMGFVRGQKVKVLLNAPLKDPVKYEVMGYEVSLRRSEASMIRVVQQNDTQQNKESEPTAAELYTILNQEPPTTKTEVSAERIINVALVGNPNCGKTTLFNVASGAHEHVGNYSGVTVDAKSGHFNYKGYHINITDLPGTYSLAAYSPEELYVRKHIGQQMPDVIINVAVASNLERNLYLTSELIDMDVRAVMALNMYDELERRGDQLDYKTLSTMIGMPVVPTMTCKGKGVDTLFDTVIEVFENRNPKVRHVHINYGVALESAIKELSQQLKDSPTTIKHYSPRYLSIKILEGDTEVQKLLSKGGEDYELLKKTRDTYIKKIELEQDEDVESIIANKKYGFIDGLIKTILTPSVQQQRRSISSTIDAIVTNKWLGFPIFITIMWLMFEATFTLGGYPMEWIESIVAWIGSMVDHHMTDGALKDLLIDGIIGGVGGVIIFLPNILILYLFISFMEDTGYMARAAFIMDKLMHRIGLHGKSFIPLVMGFGCNVPAIMATRTIESRSSRLITILINPFMSCSARLPVYLLLVGAFFPHKASLVMLGMYLLGILIAIITSLLLRKLHFKKEETPFVMELPPFRMPTSKSILRHMWGKGKQYLQKMGGIILIASIIVWYLSYYPQHKTTDTPTPEQIAMQQEQSYLGQLGKFIEPAIAPLGFNWKSGVSLLSGVAAKEIVVSTMGVLYQNGETDNSDTIAQQLKQINNQTGEPEFTPITALAFMAFVLLYFPCLATIVAIVKESGSIGWGIFSILYTTTTAWIVAFIIHTLGQLF